jgi:hypothetical protein
VTGVLGGDPPYQRDPDLLDAALDWAAKYELAVLLDLHAASGSQNVQDQANGSARGAGTGRGTGLGPSSTSSPLAPSPADWKDDDCHRRRLQRARLPGPGPYAINCVHR